MRQVLSSILILWFGVSAFAQLPPREFPVDAAMRIRVDFWKRVYTEITSEQGFLHDSEDLRVVYGTIDLKSRSRREQQRAVDEERARIKNTLLSIIAKNKTNLTPEETKILNQVYDPPVEKVREMISRIRYQRGLKDRYYEGLVRSYKYLDRIKEIFIGQGLPEALAFLPHVESSFNYQAYSKVGAAGIWQFMRSTGRQYNMRVTYVVDERRDPIVATKAAARLLRDNYKRLNSWPLALTAYNHGAGSMAKAVRTVNSTDMSEIIAKYDGRRFGFASKNFYATFIATAEISQEPEKYFDAFHKPEPVKYSEIKLPKKVTIRQVIEATGLGENELQEYNQAIRTVAFRSHQYIPEGYTLKIPHSPLERLQEHQRKIAAIEAVEPKIDVSGTHKVAQGESLYFIAKLYKVALSDLVAVNRLDSPSKIFPGMDLKIPGAEERESEPTLVAAAPKKTPAKVALVPKPTPAPAAEPLKVPRAASELNLTVVARLQKLFDEPKKNYTEYQAIENVLSPKAPNVRGVNMDNYNLDTKKVAENVYEVSVEADETLGHFAEWAGVRVSQIRKLNGARKTATINQGQRLKLPMTPAKLAEFYLSRVEYHAAIEEDFYENYKVVGANNYTILPGDTVAKLSKKFDAPHWLIKKVQPIAGALQLRAGQTVLIPEVEALTVQENAVQEETDVPEGEKESDT